MFRKLTRKLFRNLTRKLTRRPHAFRGIVALVTVLTVLIALAALAQRPGASHADRVLVTPSQANRFAAGPMDPANPLFLPTVNYDSGGQQDYSIAVADLNGDGRPDLVITDYCSDNNCVSGGVSVLLGNGNGTFQAAVIYVSTQVGFGARSVAIADVNGDGKPDIVVANACGGCTNGVGVLLGNGDGTFQPVATYETLSGPFSIAVADVNGDGKPDLVVAYFCCWKLSHDGAVGVLLGNGDGTFRPVIQYDSAGRQSFGVAVEDLNGDGKPDLVVVNQCPSPGCSAGHGTAGVLLGNGDGTFQKAVTYAGGNHTFSVTIADVNGDGKPDLLLADSGSVTGTGQGVSVLLGNGDGTFQPRAAYDPGGNTPLHVAVADVNSDGKPDLLVANNGSGTVGVLLGNGDGTFQSPQTYDSPGSASVAVADVNGDARPDLAVVNGGVGGGAGILLHVAKPTTTTLLSSLNPSFVGQTVTFTTKVASTSGTIPDGELVTFYDGTTALASVALAGEMAAYSTSSLSAKAHAIKVAYTGDAIFKPSKGTVQQVVNKYPTTTALTSSPNPSNFGQSVTFTAQVTGTGPIAPTGKVKFVDGTTTLGTATLSGGTAKLTKSTLALGTQPITAEYLGDADSAKSTSSVLNQVVQ
jgi:hypothetical protein